MPKPAYLGATLDKGIGSVILLLIYLPHPRSKSEHYFPQHLLYNYPFIVVPPQSQSMAHVPDMKTEPGNCAVSDDMWECLGAIDLNRRDLLVFWRTSWHSAEEYHALRADGNRGWLVHTRGEDQMLIAWEPTIERKSIQPSLHTLLGDPVVEVRKNRPGLLGYVAAKTLPRSSNVERRGLAFLAYWKVTSMTRGLFFQLQKTYSSHRGNIVHEEEDKVWIQWQPTWVLSKDLNQTKKKQLLPISKKPEALLHHFHKAIVHRSTRAAERKRIG